MASQYTQQQQWAHSEAAAAAASAPAALACKALPGIALCLHMRYNMRWTRCLVHFMAPLCLEGLYSTADVVVSSSLAPPVRAPAVRVSQVHYVAN